MVVKTLSYVQEHGYDTLESMDRQLAELKGQAFSSLKELKDTEARLRQENSAKIALYEAALKFLKEKADGGKLPTLQTLNAEKEKQFSARLL